MRLLSEDEKELLKHLSMWGSDAYPIHKRGRGWTWGPWQSINGPNHVFKTKRECTASFESYYDVLIDAYGETRRRELLAEAS